MKLIKKRWKLSRSNFLNELKKVYEENFNHR